MGAEGHSWYLNGGEKQELNPWGLIWQEKTIYVLVVMFSRARGKARVGINREGFYFNKSCKFRCSKYTVKVHLSLAQRLWLKR